MSYLCGMKYVEQLQRIYPQGEARAIYRLVMEERFGLSHAALLLGKDTELSEADQAELENIMHRLLQGEPVQYVLGVARFCGRDFHVELGVLIPRPETEELVRSISSLPLPDRKRLLDIGTGSGCIAVTMALAGYQTTAFDISPEALHIARQNAEQLGAEVDFRHEDILHPSSSDEQWDIIVSNPPYVLRSEAESMAQNVLGFEPHEALFVPDDDPLLFYRAITQYAAVHLSAGGWIAFEINRAFGLQVRNLLESEGYTEVSLRKDEAQNDRIIIARKA